MDQHPPTRTLAQRRSTDRAWPCLLATSVVVILTLLVANSPATLALNPLDDDAGSGRDAGDGIEDAVLIGPGEHQGRFTFPVDVWDTYAVELQAGERIEFTLDDPNLVAWVLDPDGRLAGTLDSDGTPDQRPITRTGTWYILLDGIWPFDGTTPSIPHPYTFSISVETPTTSVASWTNATWITREITWDEPARIQAWNEVFVHAGKASDYTLITATEAVVETPWGFSFSWGSIATNTEDGLAQRIEIQPSPVDDLLLPEVVTETANVDDGEFFASGFLRFPNTVGGTMRQTVVFLGGSNATADFGMAFMANSTVEAWAEAEGDSGGVVWNNTNTQADVKVLTPGAAVIGERSLSLDLDRRFLGVFDPGNAMNSTVRAPDGSQTQGERLLLWPEPGTWSFELDPSVDGVEETARQYLAGAFIPELGLVPR